MSLCKICLKLTKDNEDLCKTHKRNYIFDHELNGFRLKKTRNSTSTRYIIKRFHSHEIELTKILERYYGHSNVVTSYHPLWAVSDKGALLEYDIAIKDKKILIEYNGEQHYRFTKLFHETKKDFVAQQRRDVLKQELAKEHGYKFVVIRFDEPLIEDYLVAKIGV